MNDVEHDLRELLDRKAGSVGTVAPRLPDGVRARSRRRQLATTAMGTVAAVAIGVVSLAGLRAIDRAQPDGAVPGDDPWAGYTVFERTATIETLTLTTPSDWYLVNQWPMGAGARATASPRQAASCAVAVEPGGTEHSGAVRAHLGRATRRAVASRGRCRCCCCPHRPRAGPPQPACREESALPGDEAMFEVAIDTRRGRQMDAGDGPDLAAVARRHSMRSRDRGAVRYGHYVRFQAGRYPYVAWVGFGRRGHR